MADLKEMTLSNDYGDYIYDYTTFSFLNNTSGEYYNYQILSPRFFMLHLSNERFPLELQNNIYYSSIPALYTLTSTVSLEDTGIIQLASSPTLSLNGRGVLVGFLDTGINYTHPAFLNEQGRTRILRIWDQTIQTGTPPEGFVYGSEYTNTQIDEALSSDEPYSIVPSRDFSGHGTMLAGIACGGVDRQAAFSGAAPGSSLAIVKLKEAKQYLRDYYQFNPSEPVFQETDLMMAVRYLIKLTSELNMPLVLCIAVGTNQGSHNGSSPFDSMLDYLRSAPGFAMVCAGGNEVGQQHHFSGKVRDEQSFEEVEILVPQNSNGFSSEIWGTPPEIFSVGFVSPLGEVIERIPARLGQKQTISFILDRTVLFISYELVETISGEQVIFLRFRNPTAGIWRVRVYCSNYITGQFHTWLPISNMVVPDITFLNSDPYITIVNPGNTSQPITCSTYDAYNDAIYLRSSRGFTPDGSIKPDLAAPGVSLTAPNLHEGYGSATGSGMAAALTTGCCALILQWGLERSQLFNNSQIKTFLIRGATRTSQTIYPSREWGYGKMNVYNSFTVFLST